MFESRVRMKTRGTQKNKILCTHLKTSSINEVTISDIVHFYNNYANKSIMLKTGKSNNKASTNSCSLNISLAISMK